MVAPRDAEVALSASEMNVLANPPAAYRAQSLRDDVALDLRQTREQSLAQNSPLAPADSAVFPVTLTLRRIQASGRIVRRSRKWVGRMRSRTPRAVARVDPAAGSCKELVACRAPADIEDVGGLGPKFPGEGQIDEPKRRVPPPVQRRWIVGPRMSTSPFPVLARLTMDAEPAPHRPRPTPRL
jgi:hypothetical protein